MSTKIYNAYKTTLNICELLDKFKSLGIKAKRLQEELYLKSLYRRVVLTGDAEIVLYKKEYDYRKELFNKNHADWEELQTSQYRNLYIDFSLSCSVFPLKDKILLKFYGENSMLKLIDDEIYLIDYHYQNQCDKPEEISDDDWDERRKFWDSVLGNERPCDVSFTFEFTRNDDICTLIYHGGKDKYIPTDDERINHLKEMQSADNLLPLKSEYELMNSLPKISNK